MENSTSTHSETINIADEVKNFYKADFMNLIRIFFQDPLNGLMQFFRNPPEKAFLHAMILYGSVFALYLLGTYLLAGEMRDYLTFSGLLSISLTPVLAMVIISALSFIIKSTGGRANFKSELLTGALCGIPIASVVPLGFLARVFGNGGDVSRVFLNPMGAGLFMSLVVLYLILMMANVFYQSLKSGGVKDLMAWYLSPLSIALSFFTGFSITGNLF